MEIPKLKEYKKEDMLPQWLSFINGSSRRGLEEMAMINKAFEVLKVMSQSREERAAYISREMALHD